MKRYIITIKEFEGIQIKRFDGYFKAPFETSERFTEDPDGWVWCSRTATHMKLLLHRMEQLKKANRVDDLSNRFEQTWVVDIMDGLAVGQRLPYGNRLLPTMDMIRELDLGKDPMEL